MDRMYYDFNVFNEYSIDGIYQAINKLNVSKKKPIIVCVGSDLVLGDSLGPLIGTLLRKRNFTGYVYGTLNAPITAKEIEYAKKYITLMHPNSLLIAIDACIGKSEDVGIIRVSNGGLKPGLGVNKNLGEIGDVSITGIVAGKSKDNFNLYNLTRLNLVYKMAEKIADSLEKYFLSLNSPSTSYFGA